MLAPGGPAALAAARLWWGMFLYAAVVLLGIVGLWLYAVQRKPRECSQQPNKQQRQRSNQRWIIGGGILLPTASIALLLAFGIPLGHRMLPLPVFGQTPLVVKVTANQWYWEFHYPDFNVTLRDKLHLPTGVPVDIHATSNDVIHSFWVPRLAGKIDTIPGRINILRIEASQPGAYRGQCAEFCGLDHARMTFTVLAHKPDEFAALMEALRNEPFRHELRP